MIGLIPKRKQKKRRNGMTEGGRDEGIERKLSQSQIKNGSDPSTS